MRSDRSPERHLANTSFRVQLLKGPTTLFVNHNRRFPQHRSRERARCPGKAPYSDPLRYGHQGRRVRGRGNTLTVRPQLLSPAARCWNGKLHFNSCLQV